MFKRFRVYLSPINSGYFNPLALRDSIIEGISYCGIKSIPQSVENILIKPSLIHSDLDFSPHGSTAPSLLAEVTRTISEMAPTSKQWITIENHFLGFRKSTLFKESGLIQELSKISSGVHFVDESAKNPNVRFLLSKESIPTRKTITRGNEFMFCDFKIFVPKIRTDILVHGFAGALRLGSESTIHTQSESEICDALEVACPDLIIGDGIVIPHGGSRITQQGEELGLICISNNPLAHDLVALSILGIDPDTIPHIQLAIGRGWGPSKITDIDIGGLGEPGIRSLQGKTKLWQVSVESSRDLKARFEKLVPGFIFPLEILDQHVSESHVAGNIFLDSIHMVMDTIRSRRQIAKWPHLTICLGPLARYPSNRRVICFGRSAHESIQKLVSRSSFSFSLWGTIRFERAILKNGKNYLIASVNYQAGASYWSLAWALFFLSRGMIRLPFLKPKYVLEYIFGKRYQTRSKTGAVQHLSALLKQNEWWTQT